MNEYEVVWGENQPLGLTLRDSGPGKYVIVGKITKKEALGAQSGVEAGHELVSVNGLDTKELGHFNTLEVLKTLVRPALLRFRAVVGDAPLDLLVNAAEYSIVWSEGPLGVVLTASGAETGNAPCVKLVTGKGTTPGIEKVQRGDMIIKVGDLDAREVGYQATIDLLRGGKRPLIITFKSVTNGDAAHEFSWDSFSLGLKFRPTTRGFPGVHSIASTGRDKGIGGGEIEVGDELRAINGIPVSSDFGLTIAALKTEKNVCLQRGLPVLLTFRKVGKQVPSKVDGSRQDPQIDESLHFLQKAQEEAEKKLAEYEKELRIAREERKKLHDLLEQAESNVHTAKKQNLAQETGEGKADESEDLRAPAQQPGTDKKPAPGPASSTFKPMYKPQKDLLVGELHAVLGLPQPGEKKKCAECSAEESDSVVIERDDNDMQFYCKDCMASFYGANATLVGLEQEKQKELERAEEAAKQAAEARKEAQRKAIQAEQEIQREKQQKAKEEMEKKRREIEAAAVTRKAEEDAAQHARMLAEVEAEKAAMQKLLEEKQKQLERLTSPITPSADAKSASSKASPQEALGSRLQKVMQMGNGDNYTDDGESSSEDDADAGDEDGVWI